MRDRSPEGQRRCAFPIDVQEILVARPYFVALVIILGSLLLEHWLARRRSLTWSHTAFFRLNALVSVVFLIAVVTEVVFPGFRFRR